MSPETRQTKLCNLCGGKLTLSKFFRKSRSNYNETPRMFKTCNKCSLRIKHHKSVKSTTTSMRKTLGGGANSKLNLLELLSRPAACAFCGRFVCRKKQHGGGLHINQAELSVGLTNHNIVLCCSSCQGLRSQDYEFAEFRWLIAAEPSQFAKSRLMIKQE